MINRNNYFYKGFDIDSKSRKEKKEMEYFNPYGYNLESNLKRVKENQFEIHLCHDDIISPPKKSK